MWRDLGFTLRTLGRQPSFAAVVVITLALGIGGSTAIFSVVNAVLLRDLPYPDAGQLYLMRTLAPDGSPTGRVTPRESRPLYENLNHPTVEALAIAWSQEVQIVGSDGAAYPTTRYGVTDQFFEVFGSRMELGRGFEPDERPGPIVIAYTTWRDMPRSDPDIVGKNVQAEGRPRQVVGVTPADFEFPRDPGYWYLMRLGSAYDNVRAYEGFIRLRPGRTHEQIQADLTRLAEDLGADAATNQPLVLVAQPFLEYVVGDLRSTVTILFGATAILLLIACINVTNLLLSRATVRAREMALREAVGAGRWRIIRHLLLESFLLSSLGGALGLAIAAAGIRVLLRMAPADLPRLDTVPVDNTVLLFAVGITVLTGILVGLAPAWRLARSQLRSLMNEGGRGSSAGPARNRLFSVLVVAEIALAVLLVIGAGLLVRSYSNLTATDPGFNPERVLTFFMNVPGRVEVSVETNAEGQREIRGSYRPMANFFRELEERMRGLPGVEAVASANSIPLDPAQYDRSPTFNLPGQPGGDSGEAASVARSRSVSPEFFATMEIRMLAGRGLLWSDRHDSQGVGVVNETFARRFFPGQDPLGQRIRYPENLYVPGAVGFQLAHRTVDELEIVGVVEDVKYLALAEPAEPTIYLSTEQWTNRRRTVVVRTSVDNPESLVPAIRREIESMDPLLTAQFALYTPIVRASIARERLGMTLLVIFALVALLLAVVGIYGLMSYSVMQRTGEIAVRSAIGASPGQVMALVMGRGVRLALAGIVLGVIGAVALRQIVASQLYGLSALDLRTFILVPLVLFGVAAFACFVPALRATRIDPADLLRIE